MLGSFTFPVGILSKFLVGFRQLVHASKWMFRCSPLAAGTRALSSCAVRIMSSSSMMQAHDTLVSSCSLCHFACVHTSKYAVFYFASLPQGRQAHECAASSAFSSLYQRYCTAWNVFMLAWSEAGDSSLG